MKKTILNIFLIFVIPLISFSQNSINKQEIYSNWINSINCSEDTDNYRTGFDSLVIVSVDSLKISDIDTIGVYEEDYIGANVIDSCLCDIFPWIAYVQWIDNGITFQQKITECCKYKPLKIDNSKLILFYISGKVEIDKDIIMPIITDCSKNKEGDLIYDLGMVDHTTHYTIYCDLNGHSKFTTFTKYQLENSNNLFYRENLNSSINGWKKIIKNQLKEIESQ